MYIVKNPAKSRPLSANVRRLMKMARESPLNPNVEKIEREFTARDLAYCDMQGNIFMAAIDQGIPMSDFAPIFMNSQLAGVIDYSFSRAGGMEEDDIANYLRMPVLLKSPTIIVDTVMWLNEIVSRMNPGDNLNMAVVNALKEESSPESGEPLSGESEQPLRKQSSPDETEQSSPKQSSPGEKKQSSLEQSSPDEPSPDEHEPTNIKTLADDYEYAYWLGYIYRCECHMHDESSRMVYGAFNERFMRSFYEKLPIDDNAALTDCAPEICHRLDALLVGKLWK